MTQFTLTNSPKNVKEMKAAIRAATANDPELIERIHTLIGFEFTWGGLSIMQAAEIWLAFCAARGDEDARRALLALRDPESLVQVDPAAMVRLGERSAELTKLTEAIVAAMLPDYAWDSPQAALQALVADRDQAVYKLGRLAQKQLE